MSEQAALPVTVRPKAPECEAEIRELLERAGNGDQSGPSSSPAPATSRLPGLREPGVDRRNGSHLVVNGMRQVLFAHAEHYNF